MLQEHFITMQHQQLIPHLFRTEYRKIVSVLCRHFGLGQVEAAEDIASDTFAAAAQTWALAGIPENPVAWLYTVAKNKALNLSRRNAFYSTKVAPQLHAARDHVAEEIDLSPGHIFDSQLAMMFVLCHPAIAPEAQVGLCLRILCGFGINEIADAFLTNKETINKRLYRAKEKLRALQLRVELPPASAIGERLQMVLTTLYLLFSEGYYSQSGNRLIQKELCDEAIRLANLLTEKSLTNTPETNALLALMYFQASRFDARLDTNGEMILYHQQNTGLWNEELITKGAWHLHRSATGHQLSGFHLQAAIAYWHTKKEDTKEKWENILFLYDTLLQQDNSPMVALNRVYALYKVNGRETALAAAGQLTPGNNHFYHLLLAELYTSYDDALAYSHLERALHLAKSPAEKLGIEKKISALSPSPH